MGLDLYISKIYKENRAKEKVMSEIKEIKLPKISQVADKKEL